tara:strand:- start:75 stop:287 length:213 start_codon:yes stop_codon:yes gene_type:complete
MPGNRIKHNDLLPWFLEDHGQLPASYLKSCQKFFKELQAPSAKLQATSSPQSDAMIDPLQKINRKELKKL